MITSPAAPSIARVLAGRCFLAAKTLSIFTSLLLLPGLGDKGVHAQTGAPSNDNFASAQLVSGVLGTVTGTNVGATVESGEPNHLSVNHLYSVWYKWVAPSSGTALFTTLGSNFDTVMGVYTGNAVNALTLIGQNDDYDSQSSGVSFSAVSGTTYRIAVDSYRTQPGSITLNWQFNASAPFNTIYVSPSGTPAGTGTFTNPISDLSYAFQNAQANDHIVFRGGTYSITSPVLVNKPGLVLSNYQSEVPVVTPSPAAASNVDYVLSIRHSRIEVSGLEVRGGRLYAIKIEPEDPTNTQSTSSGVVVRNCRVGYSGADCFKVFNADNLLIEGCNIGPSGATEPDADGIDVIGSHVATVRNCFVHDTKTTGIYFKGGTTDGLIEGCTVKNAGNHGILLGQDTSPEFMRNPLLPTDPNYNPNYNYSSTPNDAASWPSYADPEAKRCIARNNSISNTQSAGIGTFSGEDLLFENNKVINPCLRDEASGFYVHINQSHRGSRNISFIGNTIEMSGTRQFVILNKSQMSTFTARNNLYRHTGSPNNFLVWSNWPIWTAQDRGAYLDFADWRLQYDSGSTLERVEPTLVTLPNYGQPTTMNLAMFKIP